MCSVFKTILYRRLKEYYINEINNIHSQSENLESFILNALKFSCELTLCSKYEHHKSNRMFRYYLINFFNTGHFHSKFFPRTKYYFGLSKRSPQNLMLKYSSFLM